MAPNDGRLIVVGGASRSGKTAYVKKAIAKAPRVFAWDCEDAFHGRGWRRVTNRAQLLEACQCNGPIKVAYVAAGDLSAEFDFWASCVMYAGRFVGQLVAVAEELADVSTPAKAPGAWGVLVRRGLKRGITIFAISQRWSEADKTAFGNASDFVIFRQSSADDVRYIARKCRIEESEINALAPLHFVRLDAYTGEIERGRLKF